MSDAAAGTRLPNAVNPARAAQNSAAGGLQRRKMRVKAGDVVTVSLAVSPSRGRFRVYLRFKWGRSTVQRPVAIVDAQSREDALNLGWKLIREKGIVEKEGWSWVAP